MGKVTVQEKIAPNLFSSYFDMTMRQVYLSGIWVKHYMKSKHKLFWAIHSPIVVACSIFLTYQEIYLICTSRTLNEVVKNLRDHLNHVAGTAKLIAFVLMRHKFYECMRLLRTYDFYYEQVAGFDCKEIIRKQLRACHIYIILFYTIIYMIIASIFVVENFRILTHYVDVNDLLKQILPLNLGLIGLTGLGWITLGFDVIFTTMCSCVTAHIKILQGAFRTIRQRCLLRIKINEEEFLNDPPCLQEETIKEMRRVIIHLQAVISVCDRVEYVYNKQALVQTSISLLEICFCLYLSSTRDKDIAMNGFYLMATMFQLMLYCWHGNELTYASSGLPYAVYDGDWLSTNKAFKQYMIITMSRMNRPLYVTIGKITPMSFSTFLTIIRASYSVFTFLKQKENMNMKTNGNIDY